jgi:hypothetical protein
VMRGASGRPVSIVMGCSRVGDFFFFFARRVRADTGAHASLILGAVAVLVEATGVVLAPVLEMSAAASSSGGRSNDDDDDVTRCVAVRSAPLSLGLRGQSALREGKQQVVERNTVRIVDLGTHWLCDVATRSTYVRRSFFVRKEKRCVHVSGFF